LRPPHAHKPSDSYLAIRADGTKVEGQWDIALRDLEYAIGLDSDGDGAIRWGEVRARTPNCRLRICAAADPRRRAAVRACRVEHLVDQHSDGAYAVVRFAARCEAQRFSGSISSTPCSPTWIRRIAACSESSILRHRYCSPWPDKPRLSVPLAAVRDSRNSSTMSATASGISGSGSTMCCFSSRCCCRPRCAQEHAVGARRALRAGVLGSVQGGHGFTVAHSITLSLAALAVVQLPVTPGRVGDRLVVLLAALNNLRPLVLGRRWIVAFTFGLIHGSVSPACSRPRASAGHAADCAGGLQPWRGNRPARDRRRIPAAALMRRLALPQCFRRRSA
jgi:hypothetical protein